MHWWWERKKVSEFDFSYWMRHGHRIIVDDDGKLAWKLIIYLDKQNKTGKSLFFFLSSHLSVGRLLKDGPVWIIYCMDTKGRRENWSKHFSSVGIFWINFYQRPSECVPSNYVLEKFLSQISLSCMELFPFSILSFVFCSFFFLLVVGCDCRRNGGDFSTDHDRGMWQIGYYVSPSPW